MYNYKVKIYSTDLDKKAGKNVIIIQRKTTFGFMLKLMKIFYRVLMYNIRERNSFKIEMKVDEI